MTTKITRGAASRTPKTAQAAHTGKTLEPMMIANLSRAIDFVKFGEAKNAALLTFASAWVLGSATLAINPSAREVPQILWGLIFGAPCFVVAALLATISFLPRIDLDILLGEKPGGERNLLFFGHLSETPPKDLYGALARRYVTAGAETLKDAYFVDLGCQIAVNSKVAKRKYKLFLWAVNALLLGFAIYIFNAGSIVVELLLHR